MLRGGGGWIAALGLAFFAGIAFIGAYYLYDSASANHARYETTGKERADGYAHRSDIIIRQRCNPLPKSEKADCINEEREAARQGYRDEYDLEAQRITATWTAHMGIAAIIGMAASLIGVGLIWFTFQETRKTNDLSKRASRAFVEPSFDLTEGNRFTAPRIAISGVNIGETTAQNAILCVSYSNEIPANPKLAIEASFPQTIEAGKKVAFSLVERDPPNAIGFYLFGTVSYDCSFGDQHVTYFCVRAENSIPDPAIVNRGNIAFRPCKPADWPKDT
jgi:hypothetical protein